MFNDFQDAMANPEPLCYDAAMYSAVRSIFDVFSRIYDDEKEFKRYKGIYTLFLAGGLELW